MKPGLEAANRALRAQLTRFSAWWTGELRALIPRSWQVVLARGTRRLLVDVDGPIARVMLQDAQGTRELAALTFAAARLDGESALRAAQDERPDEVVVRLGPEQALRQTLSLPLATEKNLRQVLAFEMDRHTPFKAEQVYFDFAVVDRDPRKRRLQVELTLMPRAGIDPLLSMLARVGLPATSLTLSGDESAAQARAVELLPGRLRPRPARGNGGRFQRALGGLALLLLAAAALVPLVQKHRAVKQLEAEVQEIRETAMQAQQIRQELEGLVAESSVLAKRRNERPLVIQVVDELTRLLPDSTWLTRIDIAGAKVKIQGESANASEVATLMVGSALFSDASFEAPVTRDLRTQQERFVISANIRRAGEK